MTRIKTGAFSSMGRIPQFLGHAALAAGVLAGGASLLNAGGAMAGGGDCPPLDLFTISGETVPLTCRNPIVSNPRTVAVDDGSDRTTDGEYRFAITDDTGHKFVKVGLSMDTNGIGDYVTTITKKVFSDPAHTNQLGSDLVFTQTNTGASYSGDIALPPLYSTLYVKDTYTVSGQEVFIDRTTNTFQTPGPLPILGAGAAFGFSRRLRGRIKAARLG